MSISSYKFVLFIQVHSPRRTFTRAYCNDPVGSHVLLLFPRLCCLCLGVRLAGTRDVWTARGFYPTCFMDGSITFCRQLWRRLDAKAFRRSRFWHHDLEYATVECYLGLRKVNLTGQIDDAEHQMLVRGR